VVAAASFSSMISDMWGIVVTMDSIRSQLAARESSDLHLWHVPYLDSRPLPPNLRICVSPGRRTAAG
jgi:hypothetical protein